MLFGKKNAINPNSEHRDWLLVSSIAQNILREQKKARRWGIFFKLLTFSYLFLLLSVVLMRGETVGSINAAAPHAGLVKIDGVIASEEASNAGTIISGLRQAFASDGAKAVILAINSPGGSPVQAGYIYDEILRLKNSHPDKKLYAVISELGASGGYYVAAAADEIYADKASLVGSIGVTASGFGYVNTLKKLGIERRHFVAGKHKTFLDPFSPLRKDEANFWETVLEKTHQQFIAVVKRGRGDRLVDSNELFSGLLWNGEQALGLGLIDGLGSASYVARQIIGVEQLHDYTPRPSALEEISQKFGVAIGHGMARALGLSANHFQLR